MQFGGGKPERDGLTRDSEPDEFFATNMDDMSDEEKLKSPVVIGGASTPYPASLNKIIRCSPTGCLATLLVLAAVQVFARVCVSCCWRAVQVHADLCKCMLA